MLRKDMFAMKPVKIPGLANDEFAYVHELEKDDAAIVLVCRVDLKKCRYEKVKFDDITEPKQLEGEIQFE